MTVSSYGNLPKLTVIMVMRNAAATVAGALDSLMIQHYPKLEVVVWDGVSSDGTLEVLARYDTLITLLISEPDEGPPDAYNRAFAHATGDFVGYLNADDTLEPGMLWAVAEAVLADRQADVLTAGMIHRRVNRDGKSAVVGYYAGEDQLALTLENVLSELPTFMLSRFYRRELLLRVGPFNTVKDFCYISNDREWMARLALMPCRNAVVPHALYSFHLHDKSISANPRHFLRIIEEHLRIADELLGRADLSASQRSAVQKWQRAQFSYGLLKSLMRFQAAGARDYGRKGIALAGWRFVPLTFVLLLSRAARKVGLMLCGGIDRG